MSFSSYSSNEDLTEFRNKIEVIADQLCQAVSGDFDFIVKAPTPPDESLDKLVLLMNFVIEGARRSLQDLKNRNQQLEEVKKDLEKKVAERTSDLNLETQKAVSANKSK